MVGTQPFCAALTRHCLKTRQAGVLGCTQRPPPVLSALVVLTTCTLFLCLHVTAEDARIVLVGDVTTLVATGGRPRGLCVEVTGAVLVTTESSHKVQRIFPNGTLVHVAGSGAAGYTNGAAATARFGSPTGIAVSTNDPNDVFVADYDGHCIRRINLTTRVVSTLAGQCGSLGSSDGNETTARFRNPAGMVLVNNVTTGREYLYVADFSNVVIRRVEIDPVDVVRFAGTLFATGTADGYRTTAARFYSPFDVAIDAAGQWLHVIDYYHDCIRRIDAIGTGMMTTLSGTCGSSFLGLRDGVGSVARYRDPRGIAINGDGSVMFVADTSNCAVRRLTVSDQKLTTASGFPLCSGSLVNGPLKTASFGKLYGVKTYERNVSGVVEEGVLVADWDFSVVRWVTMRFVTLSYSISKSAASSASRSKAHSVTHTPTVPPPPTNSTLVSHSVLTLTLRPTRSATRSSLRSYSLNSRTPSTTSTRSPTADKLTLTPTPSPSFDPPTPSRTASPVHTLSGSATPGWPSATSTHSLSNNTTAQSPSASDSSNLTMSTSRTGSRSLSLPLSATMAILSASRTASLSMRGATASTTWSVDGATASQSTTASVSQSYTHSQSCTRSGPSGTSTPSPPSGSATHPQSSSATPTHSVSYATRRGDHRVRPTWSITASDSSWSCGSAEERNITFATPLLAKHQALFPLLPANQRMLAVEPTAGMPSVIGAASPHLTVTAGSLPRTALLAFHPDERPRLLLHVAMHPRWAIASITTRTRQGDDAIVAFDAAGTLASTPTLRDTAVLLHPPQSSLNGWLPDGLNVYASTTVYLVVTMACAAERGNTTNRMTTLQIAIPAPGAPRELAERVETATSVSVWATVVVGPGSGSAVGRVGAVRSMMLCGSGDASEGPSGGGLLGLEVPCGTTGACDDAADPTCAAYAQARGAVVGNAGVVACSAVCVVLLGAAYATKVKASLLAVSQRLVAPSILLPVWIAALPSTASGTAGLIGGVKDCMLDAMVVVLGVLLCVAPSVWIGFVMWRLAPDLGLHVVTHAARPPSSWFGHFRSLFRPHTRWNAVGPILQQSAPQRNT